MLCRHDGSWTVRTPPPRPPPGQGGAAIVQQCRSLVQHSTFVKLLCSQKVKLSERVLISCWELLVVTLYEPRCWTWHERTASRPATTVRLSTSSVNSGSWSSDTPTDNIDIHYLQLQCRGVTMFQFCTACTLHEVMSQELTQHLRNIVLHPLVLQVDRAPWQGEVSRQQGVWGGSPVSSLATSSSRGSEARTMVTRRLWRPSCRISAPSPASLSTSNLRPRQHGGQPPRPHRQTGCSRLAASYWRTRPASPRYWSALAAAIWCLVTLYKYLQMIWRTGFLDCHER